MTAKGKFKTTISLNNRYIFKAIAILLPFAFLLFCECILRVTGYGNDLRLFLADQTGKYYYMNPQIGKRYFKQEINATNGNMDFFPKDKAPGTFRIFVLGSSTSLGFPYMYNGAFPRMLKYRLQRQYPDKNFEVINLSLTAINSYAVLDMAKEVVHYQPDAIMIYCGQNEYHGTLGVASSGSFGTSSFFINAFIWSKKSRVIQLVYNLLYAGKKNDGDVDLNRTLMERLASGQLVPYGSEKYKTGIRQFKKNITSLTKIFTEKKIPVFIGTLVTNLKDLHPFISASNEGKENQQWRAYFDVAEKEIQKGDTLKALEVYISAMNIDSSQAEGHFRIAELLYANGKYADAKKQYLLAKDYDQLRFRAPEEFNRIITSLSANQDAVQVVDVQKTFEENSPHGFVGKELLLEHVHPNLTGYSLMAAAFFQSLADAKLIKSHWSYGTPDSLIQHQMPITRFDTVYGYISNILLKENWPFNEPLPTPTEAEKTYEGKVAGGLAVKQYSWKEAMEKLHTHFMTNHQYEDALKVQEGLSLEFNYEVKYYEMAAKLALQIGDDDRYFFYVLKIWMGFNQNYQLAEQLFITALKNDKPDLAIPFLDYGIQNTNNGSILKPLKSTALEIIRFKSRLVGDKGDIYILNEIASTYLKVGNLTAGEKYTRKVLSIDPLNSIAKDYNIQIAKAKK